MQANVRTEEAAASPLPAYRIAIAIPETSQAQTSHLGATRVAAKFEVVALVTRRLTERAARRLGIALCRSSEPIWPGPIALIRF